MSLRPVTLLIVLLLGWPGMLAAGPWAIPTNSPAQSLTWDTKNGRMSADFDRAPLETVLDHLARESGWEVAFEPGLSRSVSARFNATPTDRGLGLLFSSLSYVVVSQSNAPPRILVFETSKDRATRVVPKTKKRTGRIENELLVKVKPGTDIDAIAKSIGATVVGRDDELGVYRLRFDDAEAATAGLESLLQNPDVEGVDYNYWMERPVSPETTAFASGGSGFDMDFKAPENGGCNVVVGLIDTPMKPFNDARDQFILPAVSVVGDTGSDSSRALTHGPSMASTLLSSLAANSESSSSSVQILPVDVYGNSETTTTYEVARGISKAVTSGANILNLSLGTSGDSAFLRQVIQQAASQGVVVFAAAGNTPTSAPTYPAAYTEVTAVTAGTRSGDIASYANYGNFVDAVAPGSSSVYWNGQRYIVSGTSSATAYVSGMAAARANPCDPGFSTLGQRIAAPLAPK